MTCSDDARGRPVWDVGPAPERARLASDEAADVCVVGLGGAGLACVGELLRLGADVVGVEAGRVGGGAAGRNGGFLLAGLAPFHQDAVARYGRDAACALYRLTLQELDRIEAETPSLVTRSGSLRIAESVAERADCARQFEAMRADALPVEQYEGPEGVGLLIPGDGTFQPLERCRALATRAAASGARLYERSPVTRIDEAGVRTERGLVRARQIVVAVDGCLERLLPELAPRVRTARLQMLATEPTTEISLSRPVYARWGYDYWQQRPDGTVAMGGARDLAGESEWTTNATPTPRVQELLERRLRETLGVHAPISHRWAASVGYTPDGLPVVAEVRPGVWAVGGYSGTGNVIGALLGRGIARWLRAGDDSLVRQFIQASGG
ncbi:MAG TPA: FAD-binding oxidoreductase [Gemmatimonadaceae bacterium]|nr:FAD-binding oxidoreductase [Gemmatimonadaceae bacterium]